LYKSLAEISWWEALCENLGVEAAILNNLRFAQMEDEKKKRECLQAFYNQGDVCWESVVKVVMDDPFYNRVLAKRIAERYGVDLSIHNTGQYIATYIVSVYRRWSTQQPQRPGSYSCGTCDRPSKE